MILSGVDLIMVEVTWKWPMIQRPKLVVVGPLSGARGLKQLLIAAHLTKSPLDGARHEQENSFPCSEAIAHGGRS